MKKPDLSSAAIKKFFLYHVEKIVLVLGVVLLGLFFWLGYSTPVFDKVTPKGMVDKANSANRFIVSGDNWDKIADLRSGDDKVLERIEGSKAIAADDFEMGPASYPVKRDSLRRDRDIAMARDIFCLLYTSDAADE